MPSTVPALVTEGAEKPLERSTIERRDPKPHDVVIDIAYAGICHSDIHQARDEWGGSEFPMVPGHEIAGTVSAVGSDVTRYSVGDRVGVGCFVDSCRECENCRAGEEQFCTKGEVQTYNGREYDRRADLRRLLHAGRRRRELRAAASPRASSSTSPRPLLCAGITLYTPLTHWGAGPGKKVAIVGMGGLGHMGVKIAHALGAEVTVLSPVAVQAGGRQAPRAPTTTTPPRDENTFNELASTFDLIVNTVSADLDRRRLPGACSRSTARWSTSASR